MFDRIATATAHWAGSPTAVILSILVVVAWAAVGPFVNFSDTWQLWCNTATTIVTFWLVFLIQATQNRDTLALHAKLDELIRASEARNTFIGIDRLSEREIEEARP